MSNPRRIFCVVLLGSSGVGKTQSCITLTADKNSEPINPTPSIGFELYSIDNYNFTNPMTLNVFDMAGFQLQTNALKGRLTYANAVIFMYDASNRKSFEELNFYLDKAKEFSTIKWVGELIANTTDPQHKEVTTQEGLEKAKKHGLGFKEVSAKDRSGLAEFYSNLFEKLNKFDKKDIKMDLVLKESKNKSSKMEVEEKEKKGSDCSIF